MNQDTPRNTDTTETDDARMTSRRDLLAAGAAAVVGATVAAAAPKAAKAQAGPGPGIWEVHGTDLVRVNDLIYAMNNELANDLTKITLAQWDGYTKGANTITPQVVTSDLLSEDYTVVRARMTDITEVGASGREFSPQKPRVITMEMYNNGYVKRATDEIVFVFLPKPDGVNNSKGKMGGSVRALMAAVPFGM